MFPETRSTRQTPLNYYIYLDLEYLRARYYNPTTGRFMSRDPNEPKPLGQDKVPIKPTELHKYLYVGGDPINGIDPSGRDEEEEPEITGESMVVARVFLWSASATCGLRSIWEHAGLGNVPFGPDTSLGEKIGNFYCDAVWVLTAIVEGVPQ